MMSFILTRTLAAGNEWNRLDDKEFWEQLAAEDKVTFESFSVTQSWHYVGPTSIELKSVVSRESRQGYLS